MPSFRIMVINETFESAIEQELADMDEAKASALKGALELGVEQILAGKTFFGAEVVVADAQVRERFLLSIGTSALK